ncbi:MAG: RNA polymerase sigma factor [Planctomycetota bacterium]|jgi:RNA polymerase sigma-70 factor (ECF subfamily)
MWNSWPPPFPERYKGMAYSLSYSMLRSREDAEEAAQDTFVKLFRSQQRFDAQRSLEPWLMRIAGNTCRDLLRRRRAARLPLVSSADHEHLAQRVADAASFRREWTEATSQAVRHEVDKLSEKLRLPLLLKYLSGSTNRQIAQTLGISVSNVKVRLARAKDILQSRLERVMEN